MSSLDYRGAAQSELLGTLKRYYGAEADRLPTKAANAPAGGYFLENGMFGPVDAEIYYGMLRYLKPKHVLEVGSGWSTLLALQALRMNEQDGKPGTVTAVDPVAPAFVYRQGAELISQKLQDVLSVFSQLGPGDVLFADTSHIFVPDHEVDHVLRAMEKLSAGVFVHFHDIFLPNDYPPQWADRHYDEQDHLATFLDEHEDWEVVLAAAWLHENDPSLLAATFKTYERDREIPPGSFWMVKKEAPPIEGVLAPAADEPHEFKSDRSGRRCLICGKTVRAKVHV